MCPITSLMTLKLFSKQTPPTCARVPILSGPTLIAFTLKAQVLSLVPILQRGSKDRSLLEISNPRQTHTSRRKCALSMFTGTWEPSTTMLVNLTRMEKVPMVMLPSLIADWLVVKVKGKSSTSVVVSVATITMKTKPCLPLSSSGNIAWACKLVKPMKFIGLTLLLGLVVLCTNTKHLSMTEFSATFLESPREILLAPWVVHKPLQTLLVSKDKFSLLSMMNPTSTPT
mmetsp:Transcript_10685/g.29449  ORF Transcript_10685/g.29449 Transcript_10685/m.29449 type:complete len:228 (+) Transcript_10685:1686-2369(+)